ncbi:MAG: SRPBCC domain-containing protein [bacterium]
MPTSGLSLAEQPSDREVVFSRLLDAPRELVWSMWSDVSHLHHWWGPTGFTTTTHEFAFVPDGTWRSIMHGPDGTDYPTRVVFREIVAPERLVYENSWDLPDAPVDFKVVVSLVAVGGKTNLSLHMTFRDAHGFKRAVERYGVLEGGVQTLDRLALYVSQV